MNKIAIIGLGYVGLPLAVEFAKKTPTIGFDIDKIRIRELANKIDRTLEVSTQGLEEVVCENLPSILDQGKGLYPTFEEKFLDQANIYIITVPTPTDKNKRPVLTPLIKASECVGKYLKKGDYIIYESTVYPGVTEDECVPVLEGVSGLNFNEDFFVGYSPERINPGDKERTVSKILKITSGSTPEAAIFINNLYKEVIKAGTYMAPSIRVAEAAKVIENSQRDINIAFVNELSKIFNKLGIDTQSVLEAAGTKWNFMPFKPGLVGGHCIGVDPYYLAQKAEESGYYPEIILAGRRINDSMGEFISAEVVKKMVQKSIPIKDSRLLLLGFTFKENCPDIRNTRVIDIYKDLVEFGLTVDLVDPRANVEEVSNEYGIEISNSLDFKKDLYSIVVLAVGHDEFIELEYDKFTTENKLIFDIKGVLPKELVDFRL